MSEEVNINLSYRDKSKKILYLDKTIKIEKDFINLPDQFDNRDDAVLINIYHNQVISTLNLTGITPYIILFFDENLEFVGATIAKQNSPGSFCLKTEYKTLLFTKTDLKIQLKELLNLEK